MFDVLAPDFVQDALYNSEKRRSEHAVVCQEATRTSVLNAIRAWADSAASTNQICWLSGPAGTGKTTVAHTIAAEYDQRGRLAASFFLWRKTGDRDDINKLVSTLAYQIVQNVSVAKEGLEKHLGLKNDSQEPFAVLRDRLWKISIEDRLSKLLTNRSILNSGSLVPNLLIIDGLDECSSREGIHRLIQWIRKNKTPFRFLLTSRPELDIKLSFISGRHTNVRTLSLTESEDDIRKYFVEQLEKVWPIQQRLEEYGPPHWPLNSDLDKLVEKSEGLFIYAATAIRYIKEDNPSKRLEDVLVLHTGLDYLYVQVIEVARKRQYFDIVMGSVMYLRYPLSVDDLSAILATLNKYLTSAGICSALRGCHSILSFGAGEIIEPRHASLRDFLTDQSRSMTLFLAPATCHGRLMLGCLSVITRAFSDGTAAAKYPLVSWYHHACFFLTTSANVGDGLREMRQKAQELVKKMDLNWIRSWMIQAWQWVAIPDFQVDLPPSKVQE